MVILDHVEDCYIINDLRTHSLQNQVGYCGAGPREM